MNSFTKSEIEIFSRDELKDLDFSSFCGFTHFTFRPSKLISGQVKVKL